LFLEEQGYEVRDTKIYQDNQSAMLLAQNGKRSSTKRTRHINIRYFFITDCLKDDKLHVEYCPTKEMLADLFTKPLQGSAFRKFCNAVLNIDSLDIEQPHAPSRLDHRSVLRKLSMVRPTSVMLMT
jgi:hypothetical protein